MKVRKDQGPPESAPEPAPHISPEMLRETLELLEAEGVIYFSEGGAYVPTEKGWKLLIQIKQMKEELIAYGHPQISATNDVLLAVTKSNTLGKNPDATIAVRANRACKDFSREFRHALKESKKIEITIEAGGVSDSLIAFGSPALILASPNEIVIRKDDRLDSRTLAIMSSKSANELKQDLVAKLRNPNSQVKITLEIKP